MGSRQYGVSLEKGETKEVGNQKESVRSGLVLSDRLGVMVGGDVTKGYDLLATSFPSAVTWAFLGFQRVSSGDRHSKQKPHRTAMSRVLWKTARKGERSGGCEGGSAVILGRNCWGI